MLQRVQANLNFSYLPKQIDPQIQCVNAVLSKFVGPVGQSDIFYECPTKNVRVADQISDRKYKNIHLLEEKKRNTSDHKEQQGFSHCFFRHL